MKTKIHVNMGHIRSNNHIVKDILDNGVSKVKDLLPVVTAKVFKQNTKTVLEENLYGDTCNLVLPDGTIVARVVYRPFDKMSCGAQCWIETDLEVKMENNVETV